MIKEFIGTTEEFEQEVKEGISILDFSATWCGPCKMLHPVFEAVSEELKEYKFLGIDVDQNQMLAARYGIRAVPTIIVLKNGTTINATSGYMDENALKNFINNSLSK